MLYIVVVVDVVVVAAVVVFPSRIENMTIFRVGFRINSVFTRLYHLI